MSMKYLRHNRGFTAFVAVLVSSLALAIGLAIYDLLNRELILSQTARESQIAIFAADTGVDCALYWDNKAVDANFASGDARGATSIFGTSSTAQWGTGGSVVPTCNTQVIENQGPVNTVDLTQYADAVAYNCTSSSSWCRVLTSTTAATTTFALILNPSGATTLGVSVPCAIVVVAKRGNPAQTSITSHGFNNCMDKGPVRLERALQVNY